MTVQFGSGLLNEKPQGKFPWFPRLFKVM